MLKKGKSNFECITLLLQGGGALGAYQAGVFEALAEAGLEPNWVAGISIGAVNAAIIAGNPPSLRVERLREFWETVTVDHLHFVPQVFKTLLKRDETEHQALNLMSTLQTLCFGVPGLFKPHLIPPWFEPKGTRTAISLCDAVPLKKTLEKLVDFDRINYDDVRLTLGTVNVTSGNFTSFDNKEQPITPEHIMASGALPPGLPPVRIDNEYYWDGGLVSNTPLQWLLEKHMCPDMLVFQVDLWSADGKFPENMAEVMTRQKDIQYSSRTRSNTDRFTERYKIRHAIANLLKKLPDDLKTSPEAKLLGDYADSKEYNIVHLIYHNKPYEGYSKDFEFSRLSMEAHWKAGYDDTIKALRHPQVLKRPPEKLGVATFDFGREKAPAKKVLAVA